jgi:inosine-uridine nucleoside N-ribohydrolase
MRVSFYRRVIQNRVAIALICALWMLFAAGQAAQAQEGPVSFRVYPQMLEQAGASDSASRSVAVASEELGTKQIIIDTDPGVDDAAALAWALVQDVYPAEILGIVATAGNADIDNATRNAQIVREIAGATDIPIYMGDRKPLVRQLSGTGLLVHGIDGLWSAGENYPHALTPNLPGHVRGNESHAWRFYCRMGRENPGATIVALGPLTNVGRAIRSCGADMQNYREIIVLGGAKFGGNTTPVAEFNIWQDPEAAELVLTSGLDITLVPLDTFTALQFDFIDLLLLAASDSDLAHLLACPLGVCPPDLVAEIFEEFGFESAEQLQAELAADPAVALPVIMAVSGSPLAFSPLGLYLGTQLGAVGEASIPDLGAMMYALDSSLGVTTTALAKVQLRPEAVRGQTIIGLGVTEKVTMIIDDRELSRLAEAAYAEPLPFPLPPGLQIPNPDFLNAEIADILAREPDNVEIVISLEVEPMRDLFIDALTTPSTMADLDVESQSTDAAGSDGLVPANSQLFVPVLDVEE